MNRYLIGIIFTFLTGAIIHKSIAQEKTPYYISLNAATASRTHEIADEQLNLQYYDAYGSWKEVDLKIYDWKRTVVATLTLDKAHGLNNFTIMLDEIYSEWELNKIYVAELKDETGKKYELPIKLIPPIQKDIPEVDIIVNPKQLECNDVSFSLVDFYGQIKGGKAPYTISWYVLNDARNAFLYQPKEEVINTEGKTPYISVDTAPDYYVALFVKDACGNVVKKLVNLVCEDNVKKINTLFFEDLTNSVWDSNGKEIR